MAALSVRAASFGGRNMLTTAARASVAWCTSTTTAAYSVPPYKAIAPYPRDQLEDLNLSCAGIFVTCHLCQFLTRVAAHARRAVHRRHWTSGKHAILQGSHCLRHVRRLNKPVTFRMTGCHHSLLTLSTRCPSAGMLSMPVLMGFLGVSMNYAVPHH